MSTPSKRGKTKLSELFSDCYETEHYEQGRLPIDEEDGYPYCWETYEGVEPGERRSWLFDN